MQTALTCEDKLKKNGAPPQHEAERQTSLMRDATKPIKDESLMKTSGENTQVVN